MKGFSLLRYWIFLALFCTVLPARAALNIDIVGAGENQIPMEEISKQQINSILDQQQAEFKVTTSRLEESGKQQTKAMLDLQVQIEAQNAEFRKLQGLNEDLDHRLQDANQRQKDVYTDLDTRIRHFEALIPLVEQERVRAEQKARAEQAAAIGREVAGYKAKIIAKIRRNIVMLPDIPYNVTAEFYVTLLPGGMVLKAELTKPSGSAAYDSTVERAIKKAQPLPLPPDVTLFDKFRELRLTVTPIKE